MALLRQVCCNYMRANVLDSVATVSLERVVLGPHVEEILASLPLPDPDHPEITSEQRERKRNHDIRTFRLRCLDFYITAAKELQTYLPVRNEIIKEAKFLDPAIALSAAERQGDFAQLTNIVRRFKDFAALDDTVKNV
ncbi:Biorientation of chromosomes in cell division protein 1-like 1 [Frankliniella fusca]|uniref:Biorientation of chromosomes in cell division protein 1-like 1 n=1 Tax=Frankliniella fusca TaxID=407009 RepID=A0AAE1HMH2_9NEOP|nr:Biorientation of chromosomes in cell division protein 1-like 1 [Frankliniella fusca]